jgi:hypothetical protein
MLSRSNGLGVKKSKRTRQAQDPRRCQFCGGTMHGIRKDAKFCGNVCRQSAYQSRTYKPKSARPKPEPIGGDAAGCLNCLGALRGKQRSFCSDACRKQYHRG